MSYFHAPDLGLHVFHTGLMASSPRQRGAPLFTPQSINRQGASDQGCGVLVFFCGTPTPTWKI